MDGLSLNVTHEFNPFSHHIRTKNAINRFVRFVQLTENNIAKQKQAECFLIVNMPG